LKLLLDFLPILLFFGAFKWAEGHPQAAADWTTAHLGFLVGGQAMQPDQAPVLLATLVVMAATTAQVAITAAAGRKVDRMLWVSLALVVLLGGATVWFRSEAFIKWKPTLLYAVMGGALLAGPLLFGRNLLRALLGQQLALPDAIWGRLNVAWVLFFFVMAALNLWVAYTFPTAVWVNYKLFGTLGLTLAFIVAQAVYSSRHLIEPPEADNAADTTAAAPSVTKPD
jgi:intracellular septation protein